MFKTGDVLGGRYRLVLPLGERDRGAVWRGIDVTNERPVAVATVEPCSGEQGWRVERFLEAMETVAELRHPNVVPVLGHGEVEGGGAFAAMELLEGPSLAARLSEEPTLTLGQLMAVASDCLDGLSALHSAGVVHGAIEPGNVVLVEGAGQPVPMLVGIAHSRGTARAGVEDPEDDGYLTVLAYTSPEQARNEVELEPASDLYCFGVVLYECIGGRLPNLGRTAEEIRVAVLSANAPTLYTVRPDIPVLLTRVVQRAMAQKPIGRPPTAMALKEALVSAARVLPARLRDENLPVGQRGVHRPSQVEAAAKAREHRAPARAAQAAPLPGSSPLDSPRIQTAKSAIKTTIPHWHRKDLAEGAEAAQWGLPGPAIPGPELFGGSPASPPAVRVQAPPAAPAERPEVSARAGTAEPEPTALGEDSTRGREPARPGSLDPREGVPPGPLGQGPDRVPEGQPAQAESARPPLARPRPGPQDMTDRLFAPPKPAGAGSVERPRPGPRDMTDRLFAPQSPSRGAGAERDTAEAEPAGAPAPRAEPAGQGEGATAAAAPTAPSLAEGGWEDPPEVDEADLEIDVELGTPAPLAATPPKAPPKAPAGAVTRPAALAAPASPSARRGAPAAGGPRAPVVPAVPVASAGAVPASSPATDSGAEAPEPAAPPLAPAAEASVPAAPPLAPAAEAPVPAAPPLAPAAEAPVPAAPAVAPTSEAPVLVAAHEPEAKPRSGRPLILVAAATLVGLGLVALVVLLVVVREGDGARDRTASDELAAAALRPGPVQDAGEGSAGGATLAPSVPDGEAAPLPDGGAEAAEGAPRLVRITLVGVPEGATVKLGGQRVEGPTLEVAPGNRPVKLEVVAPGFVRWSRAIRAESDLSVEVVLVARGGRPGPGKSPAKSGGSLVRDPGF